MAVPTTCCTTRSPRWESKSRSLKTHTTLISGRQPFVRTRSCSSVKFLRTPRTTCSTLKAYRRLHTQVAFRSCSTTPCQLLTAFVRWSGAQTSWCTPQPSSLVVTAHQLPVPLSTAASSTSQQVVVSPTSPSQTPATTVLRIGQRLAQVRTSSRHACKCCATSACRQALSTHGASCKVLKHSHCVWIATGRTLQRLLSSCRSKTQ